MKKELIFGVLILFFLAVNVSAQNCTIKEDCYPEGFAPQPCGVFYSCLNETCVVGSNACTNVTNVTCSEDAKICPDGSIVERDPNNNCSFFACLTSCAAEGGMCGGIGGFECCEGLTCELDGDYPDAEGVCIAAEICLDQCGDGTCNEVVCYGENCPCAENAESCPEDCGGEEKRTPWWGLFLGLVVIVFLIIVGLKIAKWLIWAAVIAAVILVLLYLFVL